MIDDLKKAIEKIQSLSEKDQKHVADLILDEIRWSETFKNSQSTLTNLADEAIQDYQKGNVTPLEL